MIVEKKFIKDLNITVNEKQSKKKQNKRISQMQKNYWHPQMQTNSIRLIE